MSNWIEDESKRRKFWAKADYHGLSRDEVHDILGVQSLSDYRGSLGGALNALVKAKSSNGNGRSTALQVSDAKDLYQSQELYEFGLAVRSFAPWANNEKHPMTDAEVALTVRRGDALGVDVLNPHEVQIWKDRHGIQFQLAYTLMAQWANQILGGHTQPRYCPLTKEEKVLQGIPESHEATRCTFVMKDDIPLIAQMVEAGWDPQQAREDLMVVGIGTASPDEWGQYFAPNGRSKRWKLQKRAYTDALRRRFGTPSRRDIEELRRARGEDNITTEDWREAGGELPGNQGVERLARMKAREPLSAEQVEKGCSLLSGDGIDIDGQPFTASPQPDDNVVDGEFSEPDGDDALIEAMSYTTESGKRLGNLSLGELESMLDQVVALDNPSAKMVKVKGYLETLIEHLLSFAGEKQEPALV
jgi:hypothetical protein